MAVGQYGRRIGRSGAAGGGTCTRIGVAIAGLVVAATSTSGGAGASATASGGYSVANQTAIQVFNFVGTNIQALAAGLSDVAGIVQAA